MREGPNNKWEIVKDLAEEVVRHIPDMIDVWQHHHDNDQSDHDVDHDNTVDSDDDPGVGDDHYSGDDFGDDPD